MRQQFLLKQLVHHAILALFESLHLSILPPHHSKASLHLVDEVVVALDLVIHVQVLLRQVQLDFVGLISRCICVQMSELLWVV